MPTPGSVSRFTTAPPASENQIMRIVYLTLGFFILLNIGAACRTPQPVPEECEQLSGGLIRCNAEPARRHG